MSFAATCWRFLTRQRAALVLRYCEDLSETGVAAALGTSPKAVRSLVSRGLINGRRPSRRRREPPGGGFRRDGIALCEPRSSSAHYGASEPPSRCVVRRFHTYPGCSAHQRFLVSTMSLGLHLDQHDD